MPFTRNIYDNLADIGQEDTILLGDFNFRDIYWDINTGASPGAQLFFYSISDNFLVQLITSPTRDKYINDLLLTNNTSIIQDVFVEPPFSTSD